MDKIIAIAGPTAVGKTALSFYLADHYRTELISGDAYQIYKGMDIGTAKPTADELSRFVIISSILPDRTNPIQRPVFVTWRQRSPAA